MPSKRNINHYKSGNWFGKPYLFFGDYLKYKFNTSLYKLPINANLSCPNRDGTIGTSGCIYCSEDGSASPTSYGLSHITKQMDNAKNSLRRRDAKTKYIAYFQAYTNTYASTAELKELYDIAIAFEDVIGMMIATRPDCLTEEVIDLIADYKRDNFELWLEIGMQSMHEKSLRLLQRGHLHTATRDSIFRASQRGIPVCAHIIIGIPDESWDEIMETAREISSMPVRGIKFHHLHVIKGTSLEKYYLDGKIKTITFNEYISTICDFIERLRPDIIIHRLLGDRDEATLVAPLWGLHKGTVIKAIEDEFIRRGSYQGLLYEDNNLFGID
ncbi:MAG: TIGR01212 family radical SAM protein [Spirochaetota bacterium]|nr:TIGR01212 family radical SAM protein [Spirochaetota bacterium]